MDGDLAFLIFSLSNIEVVCLIAYYHRSGNLCLRSSALKLHWEKQINVEAKLWFALMGSKFMLAIINPDTVPGKGKQFEDQIMVYIKASKVACGRFKYTSIGNTFLL